jgi:hypothetical protein
LRRFLLAALLLLPLMPDSASAATACDVAAGEFQYPLVVGDCYKCPAGYNHDILYPPGDARVCTRSGLETTAIRQGDASFLCPAGQFPDFLTGTCNSCPAGYDVGLGVCTQADNRTADYSSSYKVSCDAGSFDGGSNNCYTCPAGYNPGFLTNTCTRTTSSREAMSQCGTRSETCTTTQTGSFCAVPPFTNEWCATIGVPLTPVYSTSCTTSYTGCGSGGTVVGREGPIADKYYSCAAGSAVDAIGLLLAYNDPNKCLRSSTSTVNASFAHSINQGCPGGTFQAGLTNNCYSCPSGYSHNGALPVEIPGVCFNNSQVAQTQHGNISFLCPAGQFLDLLSNDCYACAPGYTQNAALSANTTGVCYEKLDMVAALVPPKMAGDACLGLFQGNCAADLICDGGSGKCRHDPPQNGEACGVLVPCSPGPLDTNPNDDLAAQGSLTCLDFTCKVKPGVNQACDSLVADSCADDLVCVLGECQHPRPLRGERCHQLTSPCAVVDPHDPSKVLDLACHSDLYFAQPRCDTPRETGQICSGLGQGSCRPGNLCALTYDESKVGAEVAFRCTPRLEGGLGTTAQCKAYYNKDTASFVNAGALAVLYGYGSSAGAGVTGSIETGVAYGPATAGNPNGEFGCYQTTCIGVQTSAGVNDSACIGYGSGFPQHGNSTLQFFSSFDIADAVTGGVAPIDVGISVASIFDTPDPDPLPDGASYCLFVGAGVGLPVGGVGGESCYTNFLKVDIAEFWDGGSTGGTAPNTGSSITNACTESVIVRAKSEQLQLTWAPVAGAQSYQILRNAEGIDAVYDTLVDAHESSYATYLDTGLTNDTTYWYHVVPKDDQGTALCTTVAASGTPIARIRTR